MANSFLGEIRMFSGKYVPKKWALCDGEMLSVLSNDALFSLLGTTYGGDGRTTFALPDLRGRVPMHYGSGPGLTPRFIGEQFGVEDITLDGKEMPAHTHRLNASTDDATSKSPINHVLAKATSSFYDKKAIKTPVNLSNLAVSPTGGGKPHTNMQPYTGITFIISLFGEYPPKN